MSQHVRAATRTRLRFPLLLLVGMVQVESDAAEATLATILLPQEQEIQLALEAAPEHLRADATVYVFGTGGYRKVHSGTNGFTCMVNRDGNQRGDHDLKPTCWDPEGTRTIVPIMLRVGELIAKRMSADEIAHDIAAGFRERRFSSPQRAGIAYMLKGDLHYDSKTLTLTSKTLTPPHYMIYAPGVTNEDIGFNGEALRRNPGLPWVWDGYSGGTRIAYIIVPAAIFATHHH
jgi:hypothetical protein